MRYCRLEAFLRFIDSHQNYTAYVSVLSSVRVLCRGIQGLNSLKSSPSGQLYIAIISTGSCTAIIIRDVYVDIIIRAVYIVAVIIIVAAWAFALFLPGSLLLRVIPRSPFRMTRS